MIVVRIELWPNGIKERAREIGSMVIANDRTGTSEHGNYQVELAHAERFSGKHPEPWKHGRVMGHFRNLSPYHLLRAALNACLNVEPQVKATGLIDYARAGGLAAVAQAMKPGPDGKADTIAAEAGRVDPPKVNNSGGAQ